MTLISILHNANVSNIFKKNQKRKYLKGNVKKELVESIPSDIEYNLKIIKFSSKTVNL